MSPHEPPGMPCEPKNSPKCLEVLQGFKSILRHSNALFFTYMVEWTQRVGLANVSPKGLYHVMRG